MDTTNEKHLHLFNWKLVKLLGLCHILKPNAFQIYGYNIYRATLFILLVLPMPIVIISVSFGIYYLINDAIAFISNIFCVAFFFISGFKAVTVLYFSNEIWKCFEISCLNFLSYRNYNKNIFRQWQNRTFRKTFLLFSIYTIPSLFWLMSSNFFSHYYITIRNIDDTHSNYRLNLFNLYPIVSDETYNKNFTIIYYMEIFLATLFVFFLLSFDIITVMLSYALCCHLETISEALKMLGHQPCVDNDILSKY